MTFDRHHLRLALRKWARTLHIYLSLFGLFLLLFFAVTGFMLNHGKWFNFGNRASRTYSASLPLPLVQAPDKTAIDEWLRQNAAVTGPLNSFSIKGTDILLTYRTPVREFDITIAQSSGQARITCKTAGFALRLVLLHTGGGVGPVWSLVIDATAILLIITILTGVTLWLLVPKWRSYGIAAMTVCLAGCALIYFLTVP